MSKIKSFPNKPLHLWIDLIWGFRQRGSCAQEKYNLFPQTVFEFEPEHFNYDKTLLKATLEKVHTCGQAPVQLFDSKHPKRNRVHAYTKSRLGQPKTKKLQQQHWVWTSSVHRARLVEGCLQIRFKNVLSTKTFVEDLEPRFVCGGGGLLVLAHAVPLITLWHFEEANLVLFHVLRAHTSRISALAFDHRAGIVTAGHVDGTVSLYSTELLQFIRFIHSVRPLAVSLVAISRPDSNIFVCQRDGVKTILTLWTVNGMQIGSRVVESEVRHLISTSFSLGTRKNYLALLTEKNILLLTAIHLKHVQTVALPCASYVSLVLLRETELAAIARGDSAMLVFPIEEANT